jgi:hypothetical protein
VACKKGKTYLQRTRILKSANNDCASRNPQLAVPKRSLPAAVRTFANSSRELQQTRSWSGDVEGKGGTHSLSDATSVELYRPSAKQGVIKGRHSRPPFARCSKDLYDYRNIFDQQRLNYRQASDTDWKASHTMKCFCVNKTTRISTCQSTCACTTITRSKLLRTDLNILFL